MTERVGFSPARVGTVALNTFTEATRQKVFNVLLVFALVVIASASFFAQFTFNEQLKFVKDFCLGAVSVFGTLIAIVGTAQLLPSEVENRTIYTILAKPVQRFEFLLGKYLGSVLLIFLSVVAMSLMLLAALWFKEQRLLLEARQELPPVATEVMREEAARNVTEIRIEAWDPDLVKGVLLLFVKLDLLAAVTLLFSTFSTSMVFNVTMGFMVFFAGHLRSAAVGLWAGHRGILFALSVIPDLGAFNVADDIVLGNAIPWGHVRLVVLYGLGFIAALVTAAHLIFSGREI